jgi:D-xylose transport system permease protein
MRKMPTAIEFKPAIAISTDGRWRPRFDLRAYAMVFALLAIWIIFQITTDGSFLTARNFSNLTRQSCITGVLAIGMVLVIVSGNIDLSVGSVVGLAGGMAAIMHAWWNWPVPAAMLATLALGAIIGFLQGWLTAYRRIPAFIVTLAGLMVFRGAIKGATGGETVGPLPSELKFIGQAYVGKELGWALAIVAVMATAIILWRRHRARKHFGFVTAPDWVTILQIVAGAALILAFAGYLSSYEGMPVPVLVLLGLALLFHFLANKTPFGRHVYAIGGNPEAAHLSGIDLARNILAVFILMGMLGGVAGLIYTARVGSATADAGKILELDAIAACVIGGTSLMGGRGTIAGALVGALVMASLDNGMSLMNVEDFFQDIIKGLILVIAVGADIASKRGNR